MTFKEFRSQFVVNQETDADGQILYYIRELRHIHGKTLQITVFNSEDSVEWSFQQLYKSYRIAQNHNLSCNG